MNWGCSGIVINGHETIREAFSMQEFSGRPKLRPFVERCGPGGLRGFLTNEGPVWKEQRRFVIKTLRDFGFGRKTMEELIMQDVEDILDGLNAKCEEKESFTATNFFNAAVVNSLWTIMTGTKLGHGNPKINAIVKLLSR